MGLYELEEVEIMNEQLPVFVYGTLRHGCGNYEALLEGCTTAEFSAQAEGLALYGARFAFPYAAVREGGVVVGELMVIDPQRYDEVLRHLDMLEGYRQKHPESSHYVRVTRTVRCEIDGQWVSREAYLYLAGNRAIARFDEADLIPGGDWVNRHAA
jgi:gamma-glutamylcyclotransferase (GGCT)/AIG2-like uncharacterized protein YtfP